MSWNCIDDDYDYYADYAVDAVADKIDQLARKLAIASGEDWGRMRNYPGYQRNKWRETARMAMEMATA